MTIKNNGGIGIGRFIRSGNTIVKYSTVMDVNSSPETFSTDLKSLFISPLPLKKNPLSPGKEFTPDDVQVRNITNLTEPIEYKMVETPVQADEFMVDVPNARIMFGVSQTEGEQLEVTHWTVTWRDDILGEHYSGSMALEIWSGGSDSTAAISQHLQTKLKSSAALLREQGFLKFAPESLGAIEYMEIKPPVGSSFPVWRQPLGYQFVFEAEAGGELSSGTVIKRIDIDMNDNLSETVSIPKLIQ
jgi:hypothetical protein